MLFDDTSVKLLVEDFVIAVDQLPKGQLVYAVAKSGDYESGVIVNVEKYVSCCYCIVESLFQKTRLHSLRKFSVYIYIICCLHSFVNIALVTVSTYILYMYHVSHISYGKLTRIGQCLR